MKPIILLPGIGGSILVRKDQVHKNILSKTMINNRWINIYPYVPNHVREWKKDMGFNVARNEEGQIIGLDYHGKNIDVYDLGGTNGIKDIVSEFLLLPKQHQTILQNVFNFRYFQPLCEELYSIGYQDHSNLFGIPYDFRLVLDPAYRNQMFHTMKNIIEVAYGQSHKRVVIVAHSLGAIMFKWFLGEFVSQAWVDQYVDTLLCVSPPFGGAMFALRAVICGDYYVPMFHKVFKEELQKNSGIIMCLPNRLAYGEDEVLLEYNKGVVNVNSYNDLAKDHISFQLYKQLYEPHLPTITKHVSVQTHVVIACGTPTPKHYISHELEKYPHKVEYTTGDGVVDERSLHAVAKVFHEDDMKLLIIPDGDHTSILNDRRFFHMLKHYAL